MGNLILTEEEKNRIRRLYESATSYTITGTDLNDFLQQIRTKTMGQKIVTSQLGNDAVSINLEKKTLTYFVDDNKNPVHRLSLGFSSKAGAPCDACAKIKKDNDGTPGKYFAKEIVSGKFDNGRDFTLFAIYPPGSASI